MTLDLYEFGVAVMRQNVHRTHPDATDDEIGAIVQAWLEERPGAAHGDASGTLVENLTPGPP